MSTVADGMAGDLELELNDDGDEKDFNLRCTVYVVHQASFKLDANEPGFLCLPVAGGKAQILNLNSKVRGLKEGFSLPSDSENNWQIGHGDGCCET
jgi:hypothetical protein